MEHPELHLLRHGGGKALDIHFLRVQAHGLDEQLVPGLVRKADDLILDGGTVPRPHPLDDAGEEGGAVQIGPDDLVGFLVGVGDVTAHPVGPRPLAGKGEGDGVLVPLLPFQPGEVLVLTGVGEAFPFMRIHTLLEASLFAERPVLVFYPGTFNDQQLRLFNCLKPNNYYRAFNVV